MVITREFLSFDVTNTFNIMRHRRILLALVAIVPAALPFMSNVYARATPKLPLGMKNGIKEVAELARGVQHRCTLGPPCYKAGDLDKLQSFQEAPPLEAVKIMASIDGTVRILRPERVMDMEGVEKITTLLQGQLELCVIALNRCSPISSSRRAQTSTTLERTSATPCSRLDSPAREIMRVVDVLVGTAGYQRRCAQDSVKGSSQSCSTRW